MVSRSSNGRGNIYHRKDGRYEVTTWMRLANGSRKRVRSCVKTQEEAQRILRERLDQVAKDIPVADKEWTVEAYLDYWMKNIVAVNRRARTEELYESYIRNYLKPGLGKKRLSKLSVTDVQIFLNGILADGRSVRLAHVCRNILRAAINRAIREELLSRNVAALAELPTWQRKSIQPWTVEQAHQFLSATDDDPWHMGYVLLLVYGMRRGEVLGLRWCDIDLERNEIRVEQQLQRIKGKLVMGDVKTNAGRRTLPILPITRQAILDHFGRSLGVEYSEKAFAQLANDKTLVLLSSVGTPIEPTSFYRVFQRRRETAGLPRITIHHMRHTAATVLKNLGVPARDAQLLLGHAQITTTQQLYQHADLEGQIKALDQVERRMLTTASDGRRSRQNEPSKMISVAENLLLTPGGPGGTRTHDILLKRSIQPILSALPTPIAVRVQRLTIAYLLGGVAVKMNRQNQALPATATTELATNILRSLSRSLPSTTSHPTLGGSANV